MKNLSPSLSGILLAFIAFVFLCMGDATTKVNSDAYGIVYVGFFTDLFCLAVLIAVSFFNGSPKNMIKTQSLKLHLLRGLLMIGVFLSFLYAIANMQISQTYTLLFSQPFILAVLAYFILGEPMGKRRIAAIVVGFIGVVVALNPSLSSLNFYAFAAMASAVFFACTNITVKFIDKNDHWMTYVFYTLICQTMALGLLLVYQDGFNIAWPANANVPWFLLGGIGYAVGLALLLALPYCQSHLKKSMRLLWG